MKQLHLIDASAYIFRAFHGLRPLTAPDGTPTNAVYGYTQMLFRILRDAGDSLVAAVFDAPGKSFRADLYDAYKANRPPAPEEIKIQIPLCQKLTEYLGIPAFSMSGFEADDIIATLATMGRRAGMEIIIHSADKDLMQLVDDHTHLFDSMRDKTYDSAAVEEKFGVGPALIGDLLALMGDSSDNIPGVAGVGAKTAAKLLVEHGSLENVLAAASSIKGKLGEKLARDTDKARLSRVLVELRTDIPMEHPLEQLARLQTPHMEELRDMLLSLGFKRVLDQVEQTLRAGSTPEARAQEPGTANTTVTSATVPDQLVMPEAAGGVAIQIWVDGEDPLKAEPTGYALGNGTHTLYVPLGYTLFRQGIDQEKGLAALKPILEDPSIPKTIYQHKHLLQVCQRYNITVAGPVIDPLIISYLVDASRTDLSLEALTESELGIPLAGSRALMGTGAKAISFHELPPEKAQEAAKHEIEALWALGSHLESLMDEETRSIYLTMELPLTRVLARLEATGILLNREVLAELEGTLGKAMLEYEQKIREEAGYDININSPKQLQKFLFEEQGIPPMKKIKTGHSTDAETLELLAEHYEVASWIHEYRTLSKLLSTYILALPKMIHAKTGRVHTHFNQAVAATGRLSSSDPNLQNIPIRTDVGRRIREAFVAPAGYQLVALDYSQIELRVLAHLCEDPTLRGAFLEDKDIHTATACEIFGVTPETMERDMRRLAKAVNFGVIYGQTAFGLSRTIHIPMGEAQKYIDRYFERYPKIKQYMDNVILSVKVHGYARTMLGRKRPLNINDRKNRAAVERMAQNMPIQGTAADILKLAMIKAMDTIDAQWPMVKMLLTVHDELVFEVPDEQVASFGPAMEKVMEEIVPLSVPLKVDWSSGKNWAEAH